MPDAKQLWGVPLLPLLLSSLAFGAMHWPRRHGAENQGLYALQVTLLLRRLVLRVLLLRMLVLVLRVLVLRVLVLLLLCVRRIC